MKTCLHFMVAIAAAVLASEVRAQSNFATTEMNRLTRGANPNAYSSTRFRNRSSVATLPNLRTIGVNTNLWAGPTQRPNKPFSAISRGPTVSPYLALDQPFTNTATQYYTQVRPQLEQRRMDQQRERQAQQTQRQLGEMASRPPFDPRGSANMAPTGHASIFLNFTNNYMNYGGYYQQPRPRQR